MTHKLLAVAVIAVLALSVMSACAQDDAAATAAQAIETGPITGSTIVENLLNLPPQFVPSTADEHRPIHL
jgi:hypothetical protein